MAKFLLKAGLVLVVLIFLGQIIFNATYQFPKRITYGVTFSAQYAKYMELDWKRVYIQMLDELKIKRLRLPSYWEEIESATGILNFEDEDFMFSEAKNKGAKVILVVGAVQPRWPECHVPVWVKSLSLDQRRAKTLQFIKQVVERYKDNEAIEAIQVENEPFLTYFGESCDRGDGEFLKAEVKLVRGLTQKPIIISDSGELGSWIVPMQVSDIFGTTLYRDVYNPVIGYLTYPALPYFYNLKSQIIQTLFAPKNQKTIILELQAEPWIGNRKLEKNPQKQAQFFPLNKMAGYITFAQKTGFDTQYLWGVEWWYWMAQNGHPQYLEYTKTLFR